jgi:pyridoxal phosphate enzyme (YggS family)
MSADARLEQLEAALAVVQERIERACVVNGRDPADVTLLAVSKTWPAADVLRLRALGVEDFGENYDQDARAKAAAVRGAGAVVRWHFIGTVQRNKCASIARYADFVHALDRPEIVAALSSAAVRAGRTIEVLVQVSLDTDPKRGRGGVAPGGVPELASAVAAADALVLRGVMGVAPLGGDARAAYTLLRSVAERVQAEHPEATEISSGMSNDLEEAVANGSTCVRVGTALFGLRPLPDR